MNLKPLGLFNLISVLTGLFSLGLIFSCASEGGDESKITILMNSPAFANGTYQLDNVTLNDNGTNILYTKTTTTINTSTNKNTTTTFNTRKTRYSTYRTDWSTDSEYLSR